MDKVAKELRIGDSIPFIWQTYNSGTAEFQLCPVFKRGRMTDLFIDRRQQVRNELYHVNLNNLKIVGMWFSAYGVADHYPNIWQTVWCPDHKCYSLELYVPANTSRMEVTVTFGSQVHIVFWKE